MAFIINLIVSAIVYFGLGWITESIYFSINPTFDLTTLYKISLWIHTIIVCIYNFLMGLFSKDGPGVIYCGCGIPYVATIIITKFLPISEGAAVLDCVICIGSMLWAGYKGWDNI